MLAFVRMADGLSILPAHSPEALSQDDDLQRGVRQAVVNNPGPSEFTRMLGDGQPVQSHHSQYEHWPIHECTYAERMR